MRRRRYRTAVAAVVIGFAAAPALLTAVPGRAMTVNDCTRRWVCLYDQNWRRVGAFEGVTRTWQPLAEAKGARWVVNTRNDDTAHLRFSDGTVSCVYPSNTKYLGGLVLDGEPVTVEGIQISSVWQCLD
ncbi:hypothetical protein [Nocardia huaxiensis]|uniref:Peptidase inhibitor family I36 n=1 Tax=Nocardia huaxiensis TaxID=2755382 RepID=A0A7D6ZF24_9NOCA|nr:hypothetical protein [Nocardia huaxiensis]QLY29439.1 hypothetical protein H0264_29890 [Nocardia huaxiensis]UFS97011.1 hypothetical protein LPY97_03500 [Nocardia huaxiensis]